MRQNYWLAVPLLGVLAGCAGQPNIEFSDLEGGYTPDHVAYAAAQGAIPTAIVGQPFAGAQADTDRAVLSALRLPGYFPPAVFVPIEPVAARATRLVLHFDVPAGSQPCDATAAGGSTRGPSLLVEATLCSGDGWLSHARARLPRPTGASDPALGSGLAAVLRDLMPASIRDVPDGN